MYKKAWNLRIIQELLENYLIGKRLKKLRNDDMSVVSVEKYLIRCVNSILKQTFSDFERILIDNGNRDRSSEICDSYAEKDERFRIIHQSNRWQAETKKVRN